MLHFQELPPADEDLTNRILASISEATGQGRSRSELNKLFRRDAEPLALDSSLWELVDDGLILSRRARTQGRRRRMYTAI